MKRLLLIIMLVIFSFTFSCFPEREVVRPPYDPNISLNVKDAPPPSRKEERIPEYQESVPFPPSEIPVYGQEKFQVPNCYLEIANESAEHWDVLVSGEKIGVLNPHSTMRYSLNSCLAISVELHSNFPNFRTMHKAFYPNERQGNVYYWRLSYRN